MHVVIPKPRRTFGRHALGWALADRAKQCNAAGTARFRQFDSGTEAKSMIPKSGNRFSGKIMLQQKFRSGWQFNETSS
ncbi:hypothetical protein MPL3365_110142 [Mesorhizobium plurifarium]|uniref:Uncharacterized protein n=1 Tax=Mesorhizobium plurifarium TaxID=69974 RepID=A0A090FUU8_MESPL|nr:hypothetical protein MPL3365_110142 [Mesorhizobium plurifarium]